MINYKEVQDAWAKRRTMIRAEFADGVTVREIAAREGISTTAVYRLLNLSGKYKTKK